LKNFFPGTESPISVYNLSTSGIVPMPVNSQNV
jgi:hypothetical protein